MKKILSCFVVLFAAISLYAADPNIYASGLKVTNTASVPSKTTIDYVLNAQATALNVLLYDGSTLIATIPVPAGENNANYAKGSHTNVAIDITAVANGTYSWKMEATAAAHATVQSVLPASPTAYFYGPRGVAVDNSPESPYFGRIYVGNAYGGQTESDPNHRLTQQGIYILDATFNALNTEAYDGGVSWTEHGEVTATANSDWGPYRVAVSEDGYVFMTDNGAANGAKTGVYMMDPAHPENNFVSVLGQAGADKNFHRANSLAVTGSGTNRTLYLFDWTDSIVRYPIGDVYPYTAQGTAVVPKTSITAGGVANAQNSIARDKDGGFWVCQFRGQLDQNPELVHYNAAGELDYYMNDTVHNDIAITNTYRGAMALNSTSTMLALCGGGTMKVYTIGEEGGAPTLTPLTAAMPTGLGSRVDGAAFDVAGNVYVVSASTELLKVFALPKAENTYITPAPSAQQVVVNNVEQLYEIGAPNVWDPTSGVAMTKISGNVFKGYFDFTADSYFGFTTELAANNDDGGWSYISAYRYAGTEDDKVLADGSNETLVQANRSFKIEEAGKYAITVNFNTMKVSVVKIMADALYEFGDNQDAWHANVGVPMTKIEDNIFEKELTFTKDVNYFAFATEMANDDDQGAWDWLNDNVRYAGADDDEVLDDESDTNLAKGNRSFKILPGVYTIRVNMHDMTVSVTQSVAKVIVTSAEYATYFKGTKAYTMPTGMKGYVFNVANRLEEVYDAGDIVPAATPLVLGAAEGTYDLVFTTGGVAPTANSLLVGSDEAVMTNTLVAGEHIYYGLSLNSAGEASSVGFYWMAANGAAFENGAHKAFLAVPVLTYQEEFLAPAIRFEENNATDIQNIEGQEKAVKFIENGQIFIQKNGVVYDAMGRVIR